MTLFQSWLCLIYQCTCLLRIVNSLTVLSYTASSTAPSAITCNDVSGCEINCDGDYACDNSVINSPTASYLTITASGSYVLQNTHVYCPENAQCTITAIGASALSGVIVDCGTNGVCDITGAGQTSWSGATVNALTSTKLIATADGGYNSFSPDIYCPRGAATPSCIIKLRSDSSPYWTLSPVTTNLWIFIDSADELEFQCDAISQWSALFGSETANIYYHGNTKKAQCIIINSFSAADFFGTNAFGCGPSSSTRTLLDTHSCIPWTTDSPTDIPTKAPTNDPIIQPTNHPTDITSAPTKSPSKYPTKYPTYLPTLSPTLSPVIAPTSQTISPSQSPSKYPTLTPVNDPTLSPIKEPTNHPIMSPTNHPALSPTKAPTDNPAYFTLIPSQSPSKPPTFTSLPTVSPTKAPSHLPTQPSIFPTSLPTLLPYETSSLYISTKEEGVNNSSTSNEQLTDNFLFWLLLGIIFVICVFCICVLRQLKKTKPATYAINTSKKNKTEKTDLTEVRGPGFSVSEKAHEPVEPIAVREPGGSNGNKGEGEGDFIETLPSQIHDFGAESHIALIGSIPDNMDDDRYWDMCVSCTELKKGKIFNKDALFFCDGCWEFQNSAMYEHGIISAEDIAPAPAFAPQHVKGPKQIEMVDVNASYEQQPKDNINAEQAQNMDKDREKKQYEEAPQKQHKESLIPEEEIPIMNKLISVMRARDGSVVNSRSNLQKVDDKSDGEQDENIEEKTEADKGQNVEDEEQYKEKRGSNAMMSMIIDGMRGKQQLQEIGDESEAEDDCDVKQRMIVALAASDSSDNDSLDNVLKQAGDNVPEINEEILKDVDKPFEE